MLDEAAAGLARLARAAAQRAALEIEDCAVTFGGGTARSSFYTERVEGALRTAGFRGAVRGLPLSPAHGAALLARAKARGEAPIAHWIDG